MENYFVILSKMSYTCSYFLQQSLVKILNIMHQTSNVNIQCSLVLNSVWAFSYRVFASHVCLTIPFLYFIDICLRNERVNDDNCRTFWGCTDGQPSRFCCARGERFNPSSGNCDINPTIPCKAPCPEGYTPGNSLLHYSNLTMK